MKIEFHSIGIIHTPFDNLEGMPIQPSSAIGVKGTVELVKDLTPALDDLNEFSHIYLLYFFHKSTSLRLRVSPYLENKEHGLFATRAPNRPNPIGLSVVKLITIENNLLHIENVDILNGTPLLDIKPYVMQMEPTDALQIGWLEKHNTKLHSKMSDGRFVDN